MAKHEKFVYGELLINILDCVHSYGFLKTVHSLGFVHSELS